MEELKDAAQEKGAQLKREVDSLDDFEHLGHDSSPLNEGKKVEDLLGLNDEPAATRDVKYEIDTRAETVGTTLTDLLDQPLLPQKMDTNLLQMGDNFPDRKEADAKLDKFLEEYKPKGADKYDLHNIQSFMDNERGFIQEKPSELLDRYTDSEPEDDFKPSKQDVSKKQELPESFENVKSDAFKDFDEPQPAIPQKDYPVEAVREKTPEPVKPKAPEPVKEKTPEPVREKTPEPVKEPVKPPTPELVKEKIPEPIKEKTPVKEKTPEPVKKAPVAQVEKKTKIAPADAEAIFCRMGLGKCFLLIRCCYAIT